MLLYRLNIPMLITGLALFFFLLHEATTFMFTYDEEKIKRYELNKKAVDNLSKEHKEKVNLLSSAFSLDPTIHKGYIQNNPQIIKQHVMPIWKRLKGEKLIYEIHFFKPPAVSFVNFSNFKSIGKDVSDVRKDIEWVTSSFKSSQHIMMCKTYAGIRATYPIIDKNNKILGGLSMGKKIDWLPETLKERTGDESFLIYTKESTKTLVKKYYDAFVKDKKLFSDYILAEQTIPIPLSSLDNLDVSKPISEIVIDGKKYILNSYPVVDFNKKIMGYIFTLNDFKYFFNAYEERIIRNFFIILVMAIIIYFITSRRLLRMIGQAKYISKLTQEIKQRKFHVLKENKEDMFDANEVLHDVNLNIIDMGKTIEKKYLDLESKIIKQLYRDNLTHISNRNAMTRDIQMNKKSALVLFNIRSFKQVNDVFGFEAGNEVLKKLSLLLKDFEDKEHKLYHIGSDEFSMLITEKDITKEKLTSFIHSLISTINNKQIVIQDKLEVSIYLYAGICMDDDKKLVKADMALTKAKKQNIEYYMYTEAENTKLQQEKNIEVSGLIKKALVNDGIVTVYQPIYDAKTMNINKYEALVRLKDGETLLTPYHFLDVSKQTNSYHNISREVIKSSLYTCKNKDKMVSVNLDLQDLNNEKTLDFIYSSLIQCDAKDKIVFELTETTNIYESEQFEGFVKDVRKYGAKIAIDDFGTGYANFAYLAKIKPDFLKIDGSLIKNIDKDENAKKIVKTIVSFANDLNIKTIAEFVHNKEVLDVCIELNIDELQGFYLGEPELL